MKWIEIAVIAIALAIWAAVSYSEDTEGINFHFSHADDTGTKSAASYNPDAPGTGWSYTYDSGATLNSDGSWTIPLGGDDGNGISYRTPAIYDE